MSLFGPSLQAKAQQRRRLPSPAWCTAQVTATAQQRLGHRHSAGSQARPPRSPFRPLRARPPPTTRTELAIAIQTAPPVKGNGDPTRIPAPGQAPPETAAAARPQPAARPRGPPARPRRVGRGPGRQAATPNGGGAHWAAGPGGARPPLGRALPAAAARASPADCLPASPQWAACRSPASWRRLGGGRTLGGRPRLGARPRLQQLTRPALSPAPPPQPGAQRPPRGKSRPLGPSILPSVRPLAHRDARQRCGADRGDSIPTSRSARSGRERPSPSRL